MRRLLACTLVMLAAGGVAAQEPSVEDRLAAQDARIKELELKLFQLQQQLQTKKPAHAGATPAVPPSSPAAAPITQLQIAPSMVVSPEAPALPLVGFSMVDGFWIGRPEVVQIRVRPLVQTDMRLYFDTADTPIPDNFVLRRMRPTIEGTFFDIADFRLMPDFGLGNAVIQDALLDIRPWRALALRVGKFKSAVGLEFLQSDSFIMLPERGLTTNLVPNRDVGAALHGDVGGGIFIYEIAIMNGAPDGLSSDFDQNDGKDAVGRIFIHPFRGLKRDAVRNLGFGIGGTYGKQHGTILQPGLGLYRTFGQNIFFSYRIDPTAALPTTIAISDRYRFSPQFYWYLGPVGMQAEYVYSATTVTNDMATLDPKVTMVNQAWQAELSVLVTGDKAGFAGPRVKRPFSIARRHFGALELAGRYGELRIDDKAFPIYADPARWAKAALEWAVGMNWYLADAIKISVAFARTTFTGGAGRGDRRPENAMIIRTQLSF